MVGSLLVWGHWNSAGSHGQRVLDVQCSGIGHGRQPGNRHSHRHEHRHKHLGSGLFAQLIAHRAGQPSLTFRDTRRYSWRGTIADAYVSGSVQWSGPGRVFSADVWDQHTVGKRQHPVWKRRRPDHSLPAIARCREMALSTSRLGPLRHNVLQLA